MPELREPAVFRQASNGEQPPRLGQDPRAREHHTHDGQHGEHVDPLEQKRAHQGYLPFHSENALLFEGQADEL